MRSYLRSSPSAVNTHVRIYDLDYRAKRVASDLPMVSGGASAFDRAFTWNDANELTGITDNANAAQSRTYGYDEQSRISTVSGSANPYLYDPIGNRLQDNNLRTYSYFPGTNRLMTTQLGAQIMNYGYDNAGNQQTDGTLTWTYDGKGRATAAGSTNFVVNALGQRVLKYTGTSSLTVFMYDESGHLLGEYDNLGNAITETVWLNDLPVAALK